MKDLNRISGDVLDAAVRIHKEFGPGMMESVYEKILAIELVNRGHQVECQKPLALTYGGHTFPDAFRVDLLVDGCVIVELKSTTLMAPVYFKQLRTYLVLSRLQVGLLVNFGMNTLKEGFKRIVNNYGAETRAEGAERHVEEMRHAESAVSAEGRGMFGMRSDETIQSFLSTQPLRSLREEKTHAAGLTGGMPHAESAEGAEGRGVLGMRAVEVGRLNHLSQPLRPPRSLREEKTHAVGLAGEKSHAENAENAEGRGVLG